MSPAPEPSHGAGEPPPAGEVMTRAQRGAQRRAARQRKRRRVGLGVGVVGAALAVGLTVAALRFGANVDRIDISAQVGSQRPTPSAAKANRPLTILLIGSDARSGEGNQGYGTGAWEPGKHSDTTILMRVAANRKSITMVSIPRDSMVPAPRKCDPDEPREQWQKRQWNHNFNTGGPGCLIRVIEGNTGVLVDHFAIVDFGGFKGMVDALGGVPVCTTRSINDPKAKLRLDAGRHTLDGEQALGYVRTRYSVGDGSDLGRIKRQQAFLASVAQQATESSLLTRPDRLLRFLDAATQSLTTDTGFGVSQMREVAESVRGVGVDKIEFVTVPTQEYAADRNRVQWSPDADAVWEALRSDRPLSAPTPAGSATPSASASGSRSSGSGSPSESGSAEGEGSRSPRPSSTPSASVPVRTADRDVCS